MKLTCVFFLTFILFAQQILGHGWVFDPQPRGFTINDEISASQQGPCGKTTPTYPATTTVEINGSIFVSFRNGPGHDDTTNSGSCTFSLSTQDQTNNPFDTNIFYTIDPCDSGDMIANVSIIVPRPGTYYLQWHWTSGTGSNWYSCIRLFVEDPNIKVNQIKAGDRVVETLTNQNVTNLFYTISGLPAADPTVIDTQYTKHLLLDASVSANSLYYVNFTYSTDYIPLDYTAVPVRDNLNINAATPPRMITVCNAVTKTVNEVYVSIFPYQNGSNGNFTGDVSFTSYLFDARVDFVGGENGVPVSLKKGYIAYFWTAASTTQTSSKRIVVEADSPSTYFINGPYRTCNSNQYVRGEKHCSDLGRDTDFPINQNGGRQYFAVEIVENDFTGKIRVEKGNCDSYSDMSKIFVSLVLLFFQVGILYNPARVTLWIYYSQRSLVDNYGHLQSYLS